MIEPKDIYKIIKKECDKNYDRSPDREFCYITSTTAACNIINDGISEGYIIEDKLGGFGDCEFEIMNLFDKPIYKGTQELGLWEVEP